MVASSASSVVVPGDGQWHRYTVTGSKHTNRHRAEIGVQSAGSVPLGTELDVTAFQLTYIGETTADAPTLAYFDGGTAPAGGLYPGWLGTPDLSVSQAVSSPVDPCSWCSEFVLSYLPPNTELSVDAIMENAYATVAGQAQQPADTLLYGSDGGPISWPALSCGISYMIAIDVPEVLLDDVTVGISMTRRE